MSRPAIALKRFKIVIYPGILKTSSLQLIYTFITSKIPRNGSRTMFPLQRRRFTDYLSSRRFERDVEEHLLTLEIMQSTSSSAKLTVSYFFSDTKR